MILSRRSLVVGAGAAFITKEALAFPKSLVPNPMFFPGGNAGFNPNHIASGGQYGYIGVANGSGNFTNLLNGKKSTLTGTTAGVATAQGPAVQITTASSYLLTDAGALFVAPSAMTVAAIINPTTTNAVAVIIEDNGTAGGTYFNANSLGLNLQTSGTISSGFSLSTGVPYFAAVSYNNLVGNFVLTNLNTGKIQTAAVATSSTIGTTTVGSRTIGGTSGGSFMFNGTINAAMMSYNNYLPLSAMKAWGAAPWAFWYPPTLRNLIASAAEGVSSSGHQRLLMRVGP